MAAALTLAAAIAYVLLTAGNGFDRATMVFIAGYILLMAALQVASLRTGVGDRGGMILRASAAGGMLVLGALALASIGLALVIASVLAFVSAGMVAVEKGPSAVVFSGGAALLAVAVLIIGFEVTQRMVFCPSHAGLCTHGGATIDANGNVVSTTGC